MIEGRKHTQNDILVAVQRQCPYHLNYIIELFKRTNPPHIVEYWVNREALCFGIKNFAKAYALGKEFSKPYKICHEGLIIGKKDPRAPIIYLLDGCHRAGAYILAEYSKIPVVVLHG